MYFKDRKEYEKFLQENKIQNSENNLENFSNNFFQWSEEGDILLEQKKCQKSLKSVEEYSSCLGWILLDDGKTMVLLKHPFGDVYRDLSIEDYYIALYNNILMPQISK